MKCKVLSEEKCMVFQGQMVQITSLSQKPKELPSPAKRREMQQTKKTFIKYRGEL